jgi:hypothetical protein
MTHHFILHHPSHIPIWSGMASSPQDAIERLVAKYMDNARMLAGQYWCMGVLVEVEITPDDEIILHYY